MMEKIRDTFRIRWYNLSSFVFRLKIEGFLDQIEDGITVYGMINKSTRVKKYVDDNYPFPRISKSLNKYKIFIPSVWGNLSKDFIGGSYSNICIAKPKDVCTESYVESGNFDNFNDAKKHAKYFMSKFLRALLVIDKTSIIIKNSKEHKDFVFNIENIKKFIERSTELILAQLKELNIN